jgi:glycosyltransferase involved in cell wall biosynthesis
VRSGRAATVSILVPAYAAEAFIDRTLYFARGQTHQELEILVSVDASGDKTHERALVHARADRRITVIAQEKRLGWTGNVNVLLDRVTTPFFFLYFHDDVILPQYTEKLLAALIANPHAVSVHCDMGHFGGSDYISLGRTYDGDAARRLMIFMLAPYRGSPLRSLMRAESVPHVRLREGATGGVWANEPFLMEMIAAGPALHVAETLYLRWDTRKRGLTDGWLDLEPEAILAGHKANLLRAGEIIASVARDDSQRQALLFALYLYIFPIVVSLERSAGRRLFVAPRQLHPAFENLAPPSSLALFGPEIVGWARQRWDAAMDDLHARKAQ